MSTPLRKTLGDFSSIICFRALVVGVEDTLGPQAAAVALRAAGRKRGKDLATSLGFGKTTIGLGDVLAAMQAALGKDGTRLCDVHGIEENADGFIVHLGDTICSADEPQGSTRELTFTMGAIHGAMEVLTQRKLRAKQVSSILRGGKYDSIQLTVV